MENIANNAMNIGFQPRDGGICKLSQQRWLVLSLSYDPKKISHSVPPFHPILSNGVYRIANIKTRRPLAEEETLLDKTQFPGKIGPKVSCKPHVCRKERELWKIEVQPNVLTYTVRNVVSQRYLCPPHTVGAKYPEPNAVPITSNMAYLWDIRQSHRNNAFCLHIPGTNLLLHSWGNSTPEQGDVVIWHRDYPDIPQESYRFNPVGDWEPASFPCTLADIDVLTRVTEMKPHKELESSPVMQQQRDRKFIEIVVDYARKSLGMEN